jgi:hypothetical protein
MTKKEFEKHIMAQSMKLYREYKKINPRGKYLSIGIVERDGHIGYSIGDNTENGIISLYEYKEIK